MNKQTIIIDINGSDKGPENVLLGASLILKKHPEIFLTLVGDESLINKEIDSLNMNREQIKIVHTSDAITNLDHIGEAFFTKPNASITLAIKELSLDETAIGLLSSGNSGAIIMGGMKYLSLPMVRPCIAAILPSENGAFTCLVDTGANVDATPNQLLQFGKLGSNFMKSLYKIDSPKVGLLSNGAEKGKGNKQVKEAFPLFEEDPSINFVGNIEGNRALSGDCDVLVADGFAANQVLKVTEGTAARIIKDIVVFSKKNNRPEFMELAGYLMQRYDLSSLGGAIVLGIKKLILKCRGNSNENSFVNTAEMLLNVASNKTLYEE